MPYKPKYCCQCGETIQRSEWKWHASRRFCELCETEFRVYDWLPYLTGITAVLVIFVISFYFQKAEKPLSVASERSISRAANDKSATVNQNAPPQVSVLNAVQAAQTNNAATLKSPVKTAESKVKEVAAAPVETAEKVYFCGAATKKGTPCSRRVKGGGRCWQHAGQTAMLAQDKLLAGQ